ncbi:hypothetical protein [Lutibacter sp.]|uniref:hypothetical protein n=1 Tax=Lutibacter sp. TaxID=1925666 RepID=UPI00356B4A21
MKLPILSPLQKIISVTLVFLIIVQLWQWNSTKNIREINKVLVKENKALTTLNLEINKKLKLDSLLIYKSLQKIDSLQKVDELQKKQLIKITSKYETLHANYNTLSPNGKTDFFTKLINN